MTRGRGLRDQISVRDQWREIFATAPLAPMVLLITILIVTPIVIFLLTRYETKDVIGPIAQFTGIVIAGILVLVSIVTQSRTAKMMTPERHVYERLELESIALFRFDIDHADLAAYIWSEGVGLPDQKDDKENIRLLQYVSQILNLFEMAIKFRRIGIMPPDAFGSWVIWIYSLCQSSNFHKYWSEREINLRWNYIDDLRRVVDRGLEICHNVNSSADNPEKRQKEFFSFIAREFRCDVVEHWLDEVDNVKESTAI